MSGFSDMGNHEPQPSRSSQTILPNDSPQAARLKSPHPNHLLPHPRLCNLIRWVAHPLSRHRGWVPHPCAFFWRMGGKPRTPTIPFFTNHTARRQPSSRHPERLLDAQSHIPREACLAVQQARQRRPGNPSAAATVAVNPAGAIISVRMKPPGWGGFFIGIAASPSRFASLMRRRKP
jgi:hypothetical protein